MEDVRIKPSCTQSCLFLSPFFMNNLDRIGLEAGPQKNFTPAFLTSRNDLLARHSPKEDQLSPTEIEKSQVAAQIYIKLGPRLIRLLKLSPGEFADKLECDLIEHDIESSTERYHALSYTWGKPSFPARIYRRGLAIPITQNLSDALHFLRHQKEPKLLWIDALCINQSDLDEVGARFLTVQV